MQQTLLSILRCPFCGTALEVVDNDALVRTGDAIESGVLGCQCCAFPIVAGIPVLLATDRVREAMHTLEAGHSAAALDLLLELDDARGAAFRDLLSRPRPTYRDALAILSQDAEGTYFVYHFGDPTYLMVQGLLRALAQHPGVMGRVLDVCGGTGHFTRDLLAARPAGGAVLGDLFYWKLWLARRFVAPGCEPVCCDANAPLPFARDAFSLVILADAFPYIWHKRLLADELVRLAGPGGVVAMPHLHSSLGFNHSAGMTLTPAAYRDLLAPLGPRLFSDRDLLDGVLDGLSDGAVDGAVDLTVDLTRDRTPDGIGDEPSFTLVASHRDDIFAAHRLADTLDVAGQLRVNPLYRVERRGDASVLTLTFPTPEYEDEFGGCRRYLPDRVSVRADLTGAITPALLGADYAELRRRRVIIDVPPGYC